MQKYEGFRKAGRFTLTTGTEVQGELSLKGPATSLDLYSDAFFDTHPSPDIFGLLYDRSKVSLINCITMTQSKYGAKGDEQYHHCSSVFPHFVIFGGQHISSFDRTIRKLSFTVDDAAVLFCDFDVFGSVVNARPHMERIVEANKRGRKIEIGEDPLLFYCTGKYGIFAVETVLGNVSATHGIAYSSPGPEGIHVDNTIRISIAFNSERTVEQAIGSVLDIVRFLAVIAGRKQNVSDLTFLPAGTGEPPKAFEVYWCMPPHRDDDGSHKPHPFDLPIQAAVKPDEFTNLLKRWLARNEAWRAARARFSTVFAYRNRYCIDRIVGAANMFDILPSSACPEMFTLPPELEQGRDSAREAFDALPPSPERDSVLSALGRMGKATLKRKVRSRAKLVTDIVGGRFPELDLVVDQAIDCRNYYVHGSVAKIDYSKHFAQVQFFTDTLEFVFAASDLVQSGWDITAWTKQASSVSHPFGRYHVNYGRQLSELKKLL